MNSNHYQLFTILIGFRTASPIKIMLRKLSTPNIQRIKSICAIGAMFQQVLL